MLLSPLLVFNRRLTVRRENRITTSLKPVLHSRISPPLAKNLISCSFVPSAKSQTEDENFQRLDQQNKLLQRRMNVKRMISVSKFFAGGGEMMEWKTALRACLYGGELRG